MSEANTAKFNTLFAKALQISEAEVVDTLALGSVPSWDSFNALMLVSELEKGFGVKFSMKDIANVQNVHDIKENLRKNNIEI